MLSQPTTEQIIRDCRAELLSTINDAIVDAPARIAVQMMENVLRNCAERAAHEIAWMREETDAMIAFAGHVAASPASTPQLEGALATYRAERSDSLHLDDVSATYSLAGECLSTGLEAAMAAGRDDLQIAGREVLELRLAHEQQIMGEWVMVGRAESVSGAAVDALVVTGGHPFEAEPFFAIFDALDGVSWTAGTAPAVGHDVVVFYDMPGIRFTRADPPLEMVPPTDEQRAVFDELCAAGTGLVFMHHAVAGWPAWEGYAELVGGRFHYQPGSLRGRHYSDSGYLFDVRHTVAVLEPDHPVCAGLSDGFTLTDELYCFPVFADSVTPLMRTTFDVADASQFYSADLAIRGRRNSNDGWNHPPGSDLVAWTKQAGNSRVVYLQFGDGPETYADPSFRRALQNAIHWTADGGSA